MSSETSSPTQRETSNISKRTCQTPAPSSSATPPPSPKSTPEVPHSGQRASTVSANTKKPAAKARELSPAFLHQVRILHALSPAVGSESEAIRPLRIEEVSALSGITDERETQRLLYVLEGQKLVSPIPERDLTSRTWQITTEGLKTLRGIQENYLGVAA